MKARTSMIPTAAHFSDPTSAIITGIWCAILLTLPFIYTPINSQLIILLFGVSAWRFFKQRNSTLQYTAQLLIYLTPFMALTISLLFVSEKGISVMEKEAATGLFPIILFLLLNSNYRLTETSYRLILTTFVVGVLGVILFTTVRSFFYSSLFFSQNFLTFNIISPTYFSMYVGTAIFITLAHFGSRHERIKKWMIGAAVVIMLAYMVALSSRMPLIATGIVLLGTLIFSPAAVKSKLAYITLALGLAAIGFMAVKNSPRLEYRFILAIEKNLDTRLVSWRGAYEIFKTHPIGGVGVGMEKDYLNKYYQDKVPNAEQYRDYNAHNYVLHILMTFGLGGTIPLIIFWLWLIREGLKSQNTLFLQCLSLFILCSLTEVMLVTQKGIVYFYALFSLLLLRKHQQNGFDDITKSTVHTLKH